jgi:hypothetical protein
MKKLMITTAIASSLLMSSAIAQTTITGELRVGYKAVEAKKSPTGNLAATAASVSTTSTTNQLGSSTAPTYLLLGNAIGATTAETYGSFGTEQQINIQTKGKLNVAGLDYAAGFSMENDGDQISTLFNENAYIDITNASSGTTISFSRDHIQRSDSDRSAGVLFGFSPNDLSQVEFSSATLFTQNIGAAPGQAWGAGIIQATPIGNFSYNYVPQNGSQAASEDVIRETKGAYEYGFAGNLGVKGLNAYYFANKETDTVTSSIVKAEAKSWGANYNMGQVTVGYADKKYNAAAVAEAEITEKHYGIAYAVSPTLTVGVNYAKADIAGPTSVVSNQSTGTQKVKAVQLGYALGPVDLTAAIAKNTDMLGVSGNDSTVSMVRLIGKF